MYSDVGCKLFPEDCVRPGFSQVKTRTTIENQVFNPSLGEIPSPNIRVCDGRRPLTIFFPE